MSQRSIGNERRFVSALAGALALAVLGLGMEAGAQQIYACAKKNGGDLRLASGAGQCKSNETEVSWNAAGQPGPQGPQGPQGVPGPAGPAGASGVSGYEAVVQFVAADGDGFHKVPCPPGKVPLGGGVWINEGGQFSDRILIGTHPYGTAFTEDVPPIGWMGRATHDGSYALFVWAICAFAH
jgi:hypothetical protein